MALPISRDVSLAPGTQIPSTLINTIQDMIIGGRHGAVRRITPIASGVYDAAADNWTFSLGSYSLGAGDEGTIPLHIAVGEKVNDMFLSTLSAGSETISLDLRNRNVAVASSSATTPADAVQNRTRAGTFTPITATVATFLTQFMTAVSGAIIVHGIDYEVEF